MGNIHTVEAAKIAVTIIAVAIIKIVDISI
jgi:hypothetical protein